MSDLNSDFINMYIEKLVNTLSDVQKKYMILETQFEFNTRAAEENLKELEALKDQNNNSVQSGVVELDSVRSDLNSKKNALNEVNRQLEEVKELLVRERNENVSTRSLLIDLRDQNASIRDEMTRMSDENTSLRNEVSLSKKVETPMVARPEAKKKKNG